MTHPRFKFTLRALLFSALLLGAMPAMADKYVLISHAPDSDSWWNVIKNSLKQAGEDYGVQVDYRNPATGDIAEMARLIEQAAAANYDGVMVTIADFNVLQRALEKVRAKRIPLITINSGSAEQSEQLGAIMHVGQPEYDAGHAAGLRAKAAGVERFLCVNHYATNPVSFERCKGFADAIGADFRASTLDTGGVDPSAVESKVSAYLRQHPDTQGILALGPDAAGPTLRLLEKAGLTNKIWFASFDLSDELARAIKAGTVQFAIDQQPFLQGYIPVAVMVAMKADRARGAAPAESFQAALKANAKAVARFEEYGLTPVYGPRHISSGPGFITQENLSKVEKYAGQYR
ncbi:sugar ABC transporter substrate-binding protein [Achromobacter spanius]|uniref:sugar ABC transporter substrate-binding protein n=1 Tax=Achromobacter spanius TaxID=217203 RepID=UPI000F8FB101|nr:sugar ABC transporter substrate-binding protein [Achromobacter spanius]